MNEEGLALSLRHELATRHTALSRAAFVKEVLSNGGDRAHAMRRIIAELEVDGAAPHNKAIGQPQQK